MESVEENTIVFTEIRPDKSPHPIVIEMPEPEAHKGTILVALGYELRAALRENAVVLSVHGPVRPGRAGPVEVIASIAAPNDGYTFRPAAQVVVIQAYQTLFPIIPPGVN